MMQILLPRDAAYSLSCHGNLRAARSGEDLGNVVEVEVCAEGFLHLFLLRRGTRLFVDTRGVYRARTAAYAPCYAEVEELPPQDFTEVEMIEGEDHTACL